MLGKVTIEIVLAHATMLMLRTTHITAYTAVLTLANNEPYRKRVGRDILGSNVAERAGAIDAETLVYNLSDLDFRIVRYLMSPEFYQNLSNASQEAKYINYGFLILVYILVMLQLQDINHLLILLNKHKIIRLHCWNY